jgi:hypothetical protein
VLAIDAVVDLIHDGAAQTALLYDPDHPDEFSPRTNASFSLYSPDVRATVERIAADPRGHLWRKLNVLLNGLAVARGDFPDTTAPGG